MLKYDDQVFVFNDVDFAIDVRTAREVAGMSQSQFALLAGFEHSSSLSGVERACSTLTVGSFLRICNAANLSPDKYFTVQGK